MNKTKIKQLINGRFTEEIGCWLNWFSAEVIELYGQKRIDDLLAACPDDLYAVDAYDTKLNRWSDDKTFRSEWDVLWDFGRGKSGRIANRPLESWDNLDEYLRHLAHLEAQRNYTGQSEYARRNPDRYLAAKFFEGIFEKIKELRGDANYFMDLLCEPERIAAVAEVIVDSYLESINKLKALGYDAVFLADDLGSQRSLLVSPDTFRGLMMPVYKRFFAAVHELEMQCLLHSCGMVTPIIDEIIGMGVDALHPLQVNVVDWDDLAPFAGKLTAMAGFDVQHELVEGTQDSIREKVRATKDKFQQLEINLILSVGNTIMPDTSWENIEVFFYCCQQVKKQ